VPSAATVAGSGALSKNALPGELVVAAPLVGAM
jgi:hypothetical protein